MESSVLCTRHSLITKGYRVLLTKVFQHGGLAQMVERSLSMREVPGSMPGSSTRCLRWVLMHPKFRREDSPETQFPIRSFKVAVRLAFFTTKKLIASFKTSKGDMSGWPSGLRRQTQESVSSFERRSILVHECGRGFESHF